MSSRVGRVIGSHDCTPPSPTMGDVLTDPEALIWACPPRSSPLGSPQTSQCGLNQLVCTDELKHAVLLLELVQKGLAADNLFSKINLRVVLEDAASLYAITGSPAGQALLALFAEVKLVARPGFNAGTGALTLSVPLPASATVGVQVDTPRQAVVCAMLGILPLQHSVEKLFRQQSSSRSEEPSFVVMANECLRVFLVQSGVAITEKKVNFRLQNMTVTLESAVRGFRSSRDQALFTDNRTAPFWYMPAYLSLSGCDPVTGVFCEDALRLGQQQLLNAMLTMFWQLIRQGGYYPSPVMEAVVNEQLELYLRSAIQRGNCANQSVHFAPLNTQLRLYLHGHAGTGKSAFVAAFRLALEKLVQLVFSPSKTCDIVKLPLNSLTPEALRGELLVRGISDWSVERMCEQSLTKGNLVILHLEENPEDLDLQRQLQALIATMLDTLGSRYPGSRPSIILLYTSNYCPVAEIAAQVREIVVSPPTGEEQRTICANMLAELVRVATGAKTVTVDLQAAPPVATDMRPVDKWKASLAHHIARAVCAKNLTDSNLRIVVRGTTHLVEVFAVQPVTSDHTLLVRLASHDAYFFYPLPIAAGLTAAEVAMASLVDMVQCNVLKPGVIVLVGGVAATAVTQARLVVALKCQLGAGSIKWATVSLNSEADKEVVLGSPWDFPRGGLFKFIDEVNNPAGNHRRQGQEFAVITAHVNEAGQYILRELLEGNRSCTHRQMVRKDGVLFVVILAPNCPVTETIVSRAHTIVDCDALGS